MPVNNRGTGQRVQVVTAGVGSTYLNHKMTISTANGVAVQTGKVTQELSNGALEDRDAGDTTSRGYFTVTVDNG